MEDYILGLDPGSNSLGTLVRDLSCDKLSDQIVYYSVDTFDSVVVNGESLAAKRSKDGRQRRQLRVRRNRLWATLGLLIEYNLCPLRQEELDAWRIYDKRRGYFRQYPINSKAFAQWIALDFNGDGIPDYSSPFEIRHLLVTKQVDFDITENRFLLGRAIYHIAQHRGFKSNKKGLGNSSDDNEVLEESNEDISEQLELSERMKKEKLQAYMDNHNPKIETVGSAFYLLLTEGEGNDSPTPIRVRDSEYEAVRSQLKDEIIYIFNKQEGLREEKILLEKLICDKEGKGTLFFKNPPRKNRSSIGTCILEPEKKRCLESHPEFEKFRAWSFINNIRVKNSDGVMDNLPLQLRKDIYHKFFLNRVHDFQFQTIRRFIEKELGSEELVYSSQPENRTINFPDDYLAPACIVIKRLIDLFGDDWETAEFSNEGKKRRGHGKKHPPRPIVYKPMDIWHQCLTIDSPDELDAYANDLLGWTDEKQIGKLKLLWNDISDKRCSLSHKAIHNINYFLERGLQYSDAVFFAKIPDIVGRKAWECQEDRIFQYIQDSYISLKRDVAQRSTIVSITNRLIADFKTLAEENQNSDKKRGIDTSIDDDDNKKILRFIEKHFGEATWKSFDLEKQQVIKETVKEEYRLFLQDINHDYRKMPKLGDELARVMIRDFFPNKSVEKDFGRLYHPSMISRFKPIDITGRGDFRLGSPSLGNIRNPVYLRAMNILRRKVNALLDAGIITLDFTRVVIEVPREINDANMRRAYSLYQSRQAKERECIEAALPKDFKYSDDDIEKVRLLIHSNTNYINEDTPIEDKKDSKARNEKLYKKWIKEGGKCYYTGDDILLEDLGLNGNTSKVDFEHTIPRSELPDDSRMNQTLCFKYYNRKIKNNILPALLPDFETNISPRLQPIRDKVERIKKEISICRSKSRRAIDKTWKDYWIIRRHVWEMELEYWQGKLKRFTVEEVKDDFRSSQLTDTAIIAKYAALYLRSVFHRVDVQKGAVTALFRKMYGLQDENVTKDRSNHYHHAIDAAVLTLIPASAQRDRIIRLYYEREEAKDLSEKRKITIKIDTEIRSARLGCSLSSLQKSIASIEKKIRSTVFVNWNSIDRQLKPSKHGDSFRKDMHEKSFHGIVKTVKKEVKKDGTTDVTRIPRPVIRVTLSKLTTRDDIEKFLNRIVDGKLRNYLKRVYKQRLEEKVPVKDILKNILYGSSKKGGVRQPVRHVRCYKSDFSYDYAIPVHHHIFQNENAPIYKQHTYVKSRGNSLLLIYQYTDANGRVLWKYRYKTSFELSKLANVFRKYKIFTIKTIGDIPEETGWLSYVDATSSYEYRLSYVLKPGQRVFLNEDNKNLCKLSFKKLLQELHVIVNFNEADGIWLCHHTLEENTVMQDGEKIKTVKQKYKRKIESFMNLKPLVEHVHFEINPNTSNKGMIIWLK